MSNAGPELSRIRDNQPSVGARLDRASDDATVLQQLAVAFGAAVDALGKTLEPADVEQARSLRLQIAEALLEFSGPIGPTLAVSLNGITVFCLKARLCSFPRTAAEEDLFTRCRTALAAAPPEKLGARALAAAMMAWHVFELGSLPSLAAIPLEIRPSWLLFLMETPPAFAHKGDGERFAEYLQQVCDLLQQYLRDTPGPVNDVAAAFFGSAIFIQSYFNELNLRKMMRARGAIIEHILQRGGARLDELRVLRPSKRRPRIGFISLAASDGTETALLAAHMERLDRRRFEVRFYSLIAPEGKVGAVCRAAAETYVQLPGQLAAAVARLRCDDLDMALFCTNLTAGPHALTQIAAHRVAPIQVTTGASPITTGLRNMDIMISGVPNETEGAQAHYTERLVLLPGAINCYAFNHMLEGLTAPDAISRDAHGIPPDAVLFFSAANFYKILPELSEAWFQILAQVPNSYLMMMPFNPNWSDDYPLVSFSERVRAQAAAAGVDLDRIRLHPPVPTIAHLHRVIEMADVYLDAFPFSGACSVYDVLQVGIPLVARAGTVCRSRHSTAILQEARLGDWVVSGTEEYVNRAVELGRDASKRAAERERAVRVARAGLKLADTTPFAAMLMTMFDGVFSDWNKHVDTLHALDPDALAQRITALAARASARLTSFTDHDLLVGVVLPYLRHGGSRRLIDVGACMGAMTRPFIEEGWQAIMFEPDERCHLTLGTLVEAYPGQARLEKTAVTADCDGTITFHVAGAAGLSGLSRSPFAPDLKTVDVGAATLARYIARNGLFDVDFIKIDAEGHDLAILDSIDFDKIAPRLIMVEFGDQFATQDRKMVEAALEGMRDKGYRACVVCGRALGQFERHEWRTNLLAIGTDAIPSVPDGLPLFGNILLFRDDDHDFLPSLCDWLEQGEDRSLRDILPLS